MEPIHLRQARLPLFDKREGLPVPEALRGEEKYGKFNVGILGFRNDAEGLRCLRAWRAQCNAWCHDRIEDGKFADQKYLDTWPEAFRTLVVSEHPESAVLPSGQKATDVTTSE